MKQTSECKGKDILVTGGAGFIGSHLVDRLAPENRVIVLDNLFSGKMANLETSKDQITFINGDILDKVLLTGLAAQVDIIFHLAANVGVMRSINDPYFDMEVNVGGTLNLLEACRDSKVERLVYTSSAVVFGEARYLPIDEEHPVNPKSPYAVSKLAAEKYCFAFHEVHDVPVTVLRYFNVYGPRQDTNEHASVISVFFHRIREDKPVTIFGDGKQTRDFVFVEDVVSASILAATQPETIGEVFNIASGKETDLEQLAGIIKQVSNKESSVIYADSRTGEIKHSRANIEKAQRILGYNTKTNLEEGLLLTWREEIK